MSSARVARSPCLTKSPAAARAISIRVSALRRSVSESGAEGEAVRECGAEAESGAGVGLLTSAGYASVAQSAIRRATPEFRYGVPRHPSMLTQKEPGPDAWGVGAEARFRRVPAPGG